VARGERVDANASLRPLDGERASALDPGLGAQYEARARIVRPAIDEMLTIGRPVAESAGNAARAAERPPGGC
jgi:hypothetical protein